MSERSYPPVLTIAGSDSGGGAGIQADLKTFQALGCYGASAITAVTCQNTRGISVIQPIKASIVAGQIRAVLDDFPVKAVKTGMLYSDEIMSAAEQVLCEYYDHADGIRGVDVPMSGGIRKETLPLVVDPILTSSHGKSLLNPEGRKALLRFARLALLITPNLPETEALLSRKIASVKEMEEAARDIHERTGAMAYIKGGHIPEYPGFSGASGEITDVFF